MGFFDNVKAAADKAEQQKRTKATDEASTFLLEGEAVTDLYFLIEDFLVLTDKRVLFVNKNIFSSKKQITTLPYSKITAINLEKGGFMTFSKELEIHVGAARYELKLWKEDDVMDIYKKISNRIL